MTLTSGQVLQNRYRVVSMLGQGGMGAVYRAWDTRLGVPVALKEMLPQPGLDPRTLTQLCQQFRQEASVLARLDHPHLVDVIDFFEEQGNAYLVMKFIEGESLADRMGREGALPESQVLAWAEQLLDALAYCHGQGLIHRDVKPQNVVLRPDGRAMLVDFGLVKLWDPHDPQTRTAMRGMGTPEYAPPEQYDVAGGHTDARSDVYGLGATLYHALTGQAPPTATMRIVDPATLKPVHVAVPGVSAGTEAAVMQALELQPSARFQSAQEMAAALRKKAQTTAPAPQPVTPPRQKTEVMPAPEDTTPRQRQVPSWVWMVGGVALVVILGIVISSAGGGGELPAAPVETEPPRAAPTSIPTEAPATEPLPTATPDLVLAPLSPDNAPEIVPLRRLEGHTKDVQSVAFLPDGENLVSGSWDGTVRLWRVSDGTTQDILDTGPVYDMALNPDGTMVATSHCAEYGTRTSDGLPCLEGIVRIWRIADGTLVHTLEGHTDVVEGVAFSPDGTLLASVAGYQDKTVRLWQVSDGTLLQTLTGHTTDVMCVAFSPDGETLASGPWYRGMHLWQVSDGDLLRKLDLDYIVSVAFSPDGELLAAGSNGDCLIRLWQVPDGTELHTMEDHEGWVNSVAFSPDGTLLASGAGDHTVRLWRVSDGAALYTSQEHTARVNSVAFSPDGTLLASAGDDEVIYLWGVPEE